MADKVLTATAKAVYAGDLTAGLPLLDRLEELNDPRRNDAARMLGLLCERAQRDAATPRRAVNRRRAPTPEEVAYRRDEDAFSLWSRFCREFRNLFHAEIAGDVTAAHLKAAASAINPERQAARLAAPEVEADGEMLMGDDGPEAYAGTKESW